ncbi:MAG: alpha/beta fold hydrolase [Bryobacteraceae bacterium]|nr:alpha/beta fold hydrolase [Bryobacteraceae bacterium]
MRLCLLALSCALLAPAANTRVDFDPRNPEVGPFPTDFLTTPDARQRTGRRVSLPLGECAGRASDCAEITQLNQFDGFNQNARLTLRFTAPIQPETLRDHVYIAWLDPVPGRVPVYPAGKLTPVNELVYDAATNTGFAKPDEILEGGRQYLLLVTSGVRDAVGDALESHEGYESCLAGRVGGDYCTRLRAAVDRTAALAGAQLAGRRIVGASLFTAMSSTAFLEEARRVVQLFPTAVRRTSAILTANTITRVVYRQQVRTNGTRFNDETLPLAPGQLANTGRLAFFAFRSPRFLTPTGVIPTVPSGEPVNAPMASEEIHGHVWYPNTPAPPNGYPVLLAGHGLGDSRLGMPSLIAALNSTGYAVVAISAVGHGYGPESSYVFTQGSTTVEVPAPGRGVDTDGGGAIDAFEGCVIVAAGAPVLTRDCLRQTALDYMQLVHAIRDGFDLDGDGRRDLDPGTIHYLGQSLGGMYGTLLLATEPDVTAGVLNVPPGSGIETGRLATSASFQLVATLALGLRQPVLLNRGLSYVDQMPLRYQPVSLLSEPGARAIQDFWDRAEWLENPGAPIFYGRYLKSATLPGISVKRILFQMAWGDQTAANPSTSRLIRAANLREQTMLYRYDLVRQTVPGVSNDPHSFLVPQGPAQTQAVGAAAIGQVFAFLTSGMETVPNVNPLIAPLFGGRTIFEGPPALLPETLNRPAN